MHFPEPQRPDSVISQFLREPGALPSSLTTQTRCYRLTQKLSVLDKNRQAPGGKNRENQLEDWRPLAVHVTTSPASCSSRG